MKINDADENCCFTNKCNWFRYRVGAIIIENDCVLLATNEKCDYYYSVGGGVHLGELATDAVIREVKEETGVDYEIERLAFVHENFFNDNNISELKCHEISLYFLMKSRGSQELHSDSYCMCGKEYMKWIKISDLRNHKVFPKFFADKLPYISKNTEHIITRNEETITITY